MSTLHEWAQAIFPDVPLRLDEAAAEQRYFFRNTFTGAFTICEFRKNEVCFFNAIMCSRLTGAVFRSASRARARPRSPSRRRTSPAWPTTGASRSRRQ